MSKTIFSPFVLKLIVILFLVEFVKGALLITFLPVYLKDVLKASTILIGWTLSVQYIGDNLFRTPIGWLIDRIGYRSSMLIGVLSTLVSVVILAFAHSFVWILIACALLGVGTAPLWPCVITGSTEIAGEESSGTIMSVVYLSWLSGVGAGPLVTSFFLGSHYDTAFRMMIGMMVVVVGVTLFLPGRNRKVENGEPSSDSDHRAHSGLRHNGQNRRERIAAYFREIRSSMTVSPIIFPSMFAQTFALGLLIPVITLYTTHVLHLSNRQYRILLLTGGAVAVLGMIPVGKMVDKFGIRWFLNPGLAISASVLLVLTAVKSISILYGLVAFLGLGYALIIPSWNALLASAVPKEKRGAVWGFFLTVEGAGTTLGPIVSGWLSDMVDVRMPFVASGVVLFALLVMQWFIRTRPSKQAIS